MYVWYLSPLCSSGGKSIKRSDMRRDIVSIWNFFVQRGKNYLITYTSEIVPLFLVKEEKKDKDKRSRERTISLFSLSLVLFKRIKMKGKKRQTKNVILGIWQIFFVNLTRRISLNDVADNWSYSSSSSSSLFCSVEDLVHHLENRWLKILSC